MTELEKKRLYYAGSWHTPTGGSYFVSYNPANGEPLAEVADASAEDVDQAIVAAARGFKVWRDVSPIERARLLRAVAEVIRRNASELALLDAMDCGNPVRELAFDVTLSAMLLDYFAGLVTEMKGASVPVGPSGVNFSVRQPLGVVGRVLAFNHPFMFCAGKMGAPLAAGNTIVVKPSEQASLSVLRFAELIDGMLPPGVFNVVTGGAEVGAALASHPQVAKISLVGSLNAGRAVMSSASATLKPVLLELGGKNPLIAFDDADPDEVAKALVAGMNLAWCGQSCGSTSRAFIHADIYEQVVQRIGEKMAWFKPGDPTDPETRMGAIINRRQHDRILEYIRSAEEEGANLICGGRVPSAPELQDGLFVEPTVFGDVTPAMRIAREEIFGPVLALMKWSDEEAMIEAANGTHFGLTCSIWTNNIDRAHRTAMAVEAGYVWINETSRHVLGAPFGGVKQSGIGREESLEELLAFTQEKNIYLSIR